MNELLKREPVAFVDCTNLLNSLLPILWRSAACIWTSVTGKGDTILPGVIWTSKVIYIA